MRPPPMRTVENIGPIDVQVNNAHPMAAAWRFVALTKNRPVDPVELWTKPK